MKDLEVVEVLHARVPPHLQNAHVFLVYHGRVVHDDLLLARLAPHPHGPRHWAMQYEIWICRLNYHGGSDVLDAHLGHGSLGHQMRDDRTHLESQRDREDLPMEMLLVVEVVVDESCLGDLALVLRMIDLVEHGQRQLHFDRMLEQSPKRELVGNCCMP